MAGLAEVIILSVTAIGAAGAAVAAGAAWRSSKAAKQAVEETRRASQAQIISSLLDAYGSEEMRIAMDELRAWKCQYGDKFADEFRRHRMEDDNKFSSLNQGRRRVSHYFQKIHTLRSSGLIDDSYVRKVATKEQVEFYREILEPLEAALNPNYDRSSFDSLGALYDIPQQPFPMANPDLDREKHS